MYTKEETIAILRDIAGEYNIVRAGSLATIRILDLTIKLVENHPGFYNDNPDILNGLLDLRSNSKKCVNELSRDIELLKDEINREKYSHVDIDLIIRLHCLLGHI